MSQAKAKDFGNEGDLSKLDRLLIEYYIVQNTPVDALAYTPAFEAIYQKMQAAGDTREKAEVFRRLLYIRKIGNLPRLVFSESA